MIPFRVSESISTLIKKKKRKKKENLLSISVELLKGQMLLKCQWRPDTEGSGGNKVKVRVTRRAFISCLCFMPQSVFMNPNTFWQPVTDMLSFYFPRKYIYLLQDLRIMPLKEGREYCGLCKYYLLTSLMFSIISSLSVNCRNWTDVLLAL